MHFYKTRSFFCILVDDLGYTSCLPLPCKRELPWRCSHRGVPKYVPHSARSHGPSRSTAGCKDPRLRCEIAVKNRRAMTGPVQTKVCRVQACRTLRNWQAHAGWRGIRSKRLVRRTVASQRLDVGHLHRVSILRRSTGNVLQIRSSGLRISMAHKIYCGYASNGKSGQVSFSSR